MSPTQFHVIEFGEHAGILNFSVWEMVTKICWPYCILYYKSTFIFVFVIIVTVWINMPLPSLPSKGWKYSASGDMLCL
jgi:hypothetical protein